MKIIVVTGGIGSGKSEVCRILSRLGLELQYNADRRVKALYSEHPHLLEDIETGLGCALHDEDGHFVPSILAGKIFDDREAMSLVENLVFPALLEDFNSFCMSHPQNKVVVFESATILEKPQFDGFGDYVIFVDAPFEIRLERACSRDNADKDSIIARMCNQKLMNAVSAGYSDPRIDAVIVNDGSLEDLEAKTETLINKLIF